MGGQKGVCEGGSTGGTDMGRRLPDEWVAIFGLVLLFGIEDRAAGGAGGIIPETGKEVVAATPLPPPPPARPDTFRQLLLIFSDCS